jgi:hypothetical protein
VSSRAWSRDARWSLLIARATLGKLAIAARPNHRLLPACLKSVLFHAIQVKARKSERRSGERIEWNRSFTF